jgi:hypothetical protein
MRPVSKNKQGKKKKSCDDVAVSERCPDRCKALGSSPSRKERKKRKGGREERGRLAGRETQV